MTKDETISKDGEFTFEDEGDFSFETPEDIRKANEDMIVPTPALRTFDFHEMEGKPQTEEQNKKIHDMIVDSPEKPMTKGGETFDYASERALSKIKDIMKEPGNKVVVTHNSMWGLLKLWEQKGQPAKLNDAFRKEYVSQDTPEKNKSNTGAMFEMPSDNGTIYCCRHGETNENAKGVFRTPKAKLTDKGKEEAQKLGEELKDKDITKIYSSDLPRAMETAKIIESEITKTAD